MLENYEENLRTGKPFCSDLENFWFFNKFKSERNSKSPFIVKKADHILEFNNYCFKNCTFNNVG